MTEVTIIRLKSTDPDALGGKNLVLLTSEGSYVASNGKPQFFLELARLFATTEEAERFAEEYNMSVARKTGLSLKVAEAIQAVKRFLSIAD